jgi:histidinol phosphatase-like PHP family hydrolase
MRLWIPEETFVDNDQQFMEMLVSRIESIMSQEPVDIYVNPTFLPDELAARYDELWTPERMDRVIKVLKDNEVALEINARYRIPSMAFIKRAKEAGLKFTFGTNNAANELGRLEYCLEAVDSLDLAPKDMFVPRPAGKKKVQLNGLPEKITG